jgi:hypothetical protein
MTPIGAMVSPSVARNRGVILEVLEPHLPSRGLVLEIASGTGEHAIYNAAACPGLLWQATDPDPAAIASIAAWRNHTALPNVLPPLVLDASGPETWAVAAADAVVNINMIHISPWSATQGLMSGAGRLLPKNGLLFLYGPFLERDVETAPSNLAFDRSLRERNAAWGIRQLDEVSALGARHGLSLSRRIAMPANNLSLIFRKT